MSYKIRRYTYEKILAVVLVFSMTLSLAGCFGGGNKEGSTPGTAYIDDCYIEITDCKAQISTISKTFIAVVFVDLTNNGNSSTNLFFTAKIKAYQDGVELSEAIWAPADHGINSTHTTDVYPGETLSTALAFNIDPDGSSEITIKICDDSNIISEKSFGI